MATIVNSLIQGLTQQMVQARLNTADAKPFLFGTHFPVKKVNGFKWRTLTNQLAAVNVAADLHGDNATVQRKSRPLFETAMGDIPFLSISRKMSRSELKDYQTELALAQDADATKLVQYWGDDVDYCFTGIQSELEYIAWALVSGGGKLHFDPTNNATFANEFNLDYGVDDDMKQLTATDWTDAANADIIGDLVKLVKDAKKAHLNPKVGFINLDQLYKICSSQQIIKACASFAANALGISQTPDLAQVNTMLGKQAWLNGLQLKVIDQTVTRELADGSQTSENPFANDTLVLAEGERLGTTQYDILREDDQLILRAERAHTVIKKYGEIEPKAEITIGQADAVPVFDTAYRTMFVRTGAKDWAETARTV